MNGNIRLLDNPGQKMICVDRNGKEIGRVIDRKTAHMAPGITHLAIQVLVFNQRGEIILHKRPERKVGGGVWDCPTTHVLAGEKPDSAARRCLRDEYGISGQVEMHLLGGFFYEKDYGDGTCENEYCLVAFTVFGGEVKPNADYVKKVFPVPASKVLRELNSEKYPVWFRETVKTVKGSPEGKKFF